MEPLSLFSTCMHRVVDSAKITVLAISVIAGLGMSGVSAEVPAKLVKVMSVQSPTNGVHRTFFGQMSAKQTVDLGFQVGGRILEFTATEGSVIPKGTVIARLDRIPFEIEVERARLAFEQADRQIKRYRALSGSTISQAKVLDAQTDAHLAKVNLRNAEYALAQTVLIAPFDAIVAARNVANFSIVAEGTQVVRLHDMSELRVDIEVPEMLMQRLGENPNVTVSARFPGSAAPLPLEFREVNAETSEVGQTFRVTLAMEAPTDRLLLPGASVVVDAILNDDHGGMVIPQSAIATDAQGKTSVLVVEDTVDGARVIRKPVVLGVSSDGDIEVQSGISVGVEVVIGGVNTLVDGQPVRRFAAKFQ